MEPFNIGLVQMCSSRSTAENNKTAFEMIRSAAGAGAQFVLTPEMTTLIEFKPDRLEAETYTDDGNHKDLIAYQSLANELGIWLLLGSLPVKVAPRMWANRSVLINTDGSVMSRYDKIHMFDVTISDTERYDESKTFAPGAVPVVSALPWGQLGLSICYDLRFPYLYRALADAGATMLSVPSAFTQPTGAAHWHILLRARAIETGSFVFAPAQAGTHENGRKTYGHSLIVGPWGEILAEAAQEPCILMAKIKPELVQKARARIPSLSHTAALQPPQDTI